ncbi:amino acid permease-associated region [Novosphingobium nitrogenifigens DSM 19370]|uniref:Amino acid permease-associated region n=2 Tax=Novosphingobium nitrogenifigens TaxID=378548 RepID=F1ZCU1_9SPHN|nr:amino acid permease-associated region [Novosphingobium nitrogenifigens DSM 19370]
MTTGEVGAENGALQRGISWTGAFWIASGVPALVLFSIGTIAATVGMASWVVWTTSICFGFIQAFSYAEIAGLFPHKSGGASVYGAVAWARYSKMFAPVSVWCNWLAWSPVLAIGSGLAAGYSLSILFGADAAINSWQVTLFDLGFLKTGLTVRLNATFFIGAVFLLIAFAIQHRGISSTAKVQVVLGVIALLPLLLIGLVPLLTGDIPAQHLWPIVPLAHDAAGNAVPGHWNAPGITLFASGLFVAAWSTYSFETAVCYTREFRDPKTDTFKAILYSGLLCVVVFTLVPISFQGVLGLSGMLAPDIYSNMGVGKAMAAMISAGPVIGNMIVVMMVLALLLAIITSMAGSSRTLYQASADGWLPRYLSRVNEKGAPTAAMWTDLGFNLLLLSLSDYVFVLAISNVCYVLFNFLNLNSAWIHRLDRPNWERPYRAPLPLLGMGTLLSFVNLALMGMGADVLGKGTLLTGLSVVTLIVPVFAWRHYVVDKGKFPEDMAEDLHLVPEEGVKSGAGVLPFLAIAAGVVVVVVAHSLAVY